MLKLDNHMYGRNSHANPVTHPDSDTNSHCRGPRHVAGHLRSSYKYVHRRYQIGLGDDEKRRQHDVDFLLRPRLDYEL